MKSFETFGAGRAERPDGNENKNKERSVFARLARMNPALIPAVVATGISVNANEVRAESIREIDGQDWREGVETLRESVMTADIEVGANFIIGKEGAEHWLSFGRGDALSVSKDFFIDLPRQLAQFTEATGEEVERFCNAHTHPLIVAAAVNLISNEELAMFQAEGYGLSMPPSLPDIDLVSQHSIVLGAGGTPHFSAVFDPQGVWYSRVTTEADFDTFPAVRADLDRYRELYTQLFGDGYDGESVIAPLLSSISEQTLEELVRKHGSELDIELVDEYRESRHASDRYRLELVLRNALITNDDPNSPLIAEILTTEDARALYQEWRLAVLSLFDEQQFHEVMVSWIEASKDGQVDEQMLPQLREAYIRQGAVVRFVPYEQLPHEPPCAGPDYRAE